MHNGAKGTKLYDRIKKVILKAEEEAETVGKGQDRFCLRCFGCTNECVSVCKMR
jgi:hypothetical protein